MHSLTERVSGRLFTENSREFCTLARLSTSPRRSKAPNRTAFWRECDLSGSKSREFEGGDQGIPDAGSANVPHPLTRAGRP